jgi:hypothetical protein
LIFKHLDFDIWVCSVLGLVADLGEDEPRHLSPTSYMSLRVPIYRGVAIPSPTTEIASSPFRRRALRNDRGRRHSELRQVGAQNLIDLVGEVHS